jgi:hypothetical protein
MSKQRLGKYIIKALKFASFYQALWRGCKYWLVFAGL